MAFNEGPNNAEIDYVFCPRCGSTFYWEFRSLGAIPGRQQALRIAVGNCVDSNFPAPILDAHDDFRHTWIHELPGLEPHADEPGCDVTAPLRAKSPQRPRASASWAIRPPGPHYWVSCLLPDAKGASNFLSAP